MQVYSDAIQPNNPNLMVLGSQDNAFARTLNGGQTLAWGTINGGDGIKVVISPDAPNMAYLLSERGKLRRIDNISGNIPPATMGVGLSSAFT